jgi:hypothetical protein
MKLNFLHGVVLAMIALAAIVAIGSAGDASPEGITRWIDAECGLVCYEWADGSGDCYECNDCVPVHPTPEPVPTDKPTEEPTEEPTPEPTPEPSEKVKCNRGPGNGSENCDPGNSGGKPGNAGEDNE